MTIQLEIERENKEKTPLFDFDCRQIAEQVMEGVLDYEKCPYEAEVDITLTGDEEIRQINREHRGIDKATDVLSFPMTQFPIPGDFDFLENEGADSFHPDSGELMLGDIVVSVDRIKAQAEEYGHSCLREYAFLLTHSMLHLIGYDHMESEDRKVMEEKQSRILELVGITRDV